MKKILLSLMTIGITAGAVVWGTSAFFTDTETSFDNLFQAGEIDLQIDNTSYYNGAPNPETTWELRDLTIEKFFNFLDLKPGDYGEDTISLHVENNDAWLCADVKLTADDDVTCTEPENADDPNCAEPGLGLGELADQVNFIWWADDGDNVLETCEEADVIDCVEEEVLPGGPLGALGVGGVATVRVADSTGSIYDPTDLSVDPLTQGALIGTQTYYIGKAWCFGTITPAPLEQDGLSDAISPADLAGGGFTCSGAGVIDNAAQTDKAMADISFRAVQARNNDAFVCEVPEVFPTPTPSPVPTVSPTPTPT